VLKGNIMSDKKMTPEEKQMMQEAKDKKAAPKLEDAYNKSLTNTAPAPATPGSKKMANGGYVRAADGIASRGKTRGKMC
jgi:hypothetical protein